MKKSLLFSCWLMVQFSATVEAQLPKPYLLKDFGKTQFSNSSELFNLTLFNNQIYFSCSENCSGLLTTDGTTNGTHPVAGVYAFMFDKTLPFATMQDQLFFIGLNDSNGYELGVSDGTEAGTMLLGPLGIYRDPQISPGIDVVFCKADAELDEGLIVSDGTVAGTKELRRFPFHDLTSESGLDLLKVIDNRLFFSRRKGYTGAELWTSDGTASGTILLKDFFHENGVRLSSFTKFNGKYFFTYSDGNGLQLFVTDGTSAGTTSLAYLESSLPQPWFVPFNGNLVFVRKKNDGHAALCKTDGISVEDITSNLYFLATNFLEFKGNLYFVGESENYSPRLWRLNPDFQPPTIVGDLDYGIQQGAPPLLAYKDHIYFLAWDFMANERRLWSSTGEPGGTEPFKMANSTDYYRDATGLFVDNDYLYFWADPSSSMQYNSAFLYRTDGSVENTHQIMNISRKIGDYRHYSTGNRLYIACVDDNFSTNDDYASLWLVDSTANEAHLMVPDDAQYDYLIPDAVVMPYSKGLIIYNRYNDENGKELYVLNDDGTNETGYPVGTEIPAIRIYPNPTHEKFHFELGSEGQVDNVDVYTSTGQLIFRKDFSTTETNFDISIPMQGIYFVAIKFKNGKKVTKTIVVS